MTEVPLKKPEPEYDGPIWKHPYLLYVIATSVLFGVLGLLAYLAWTEDWLPRR